MGSLRNISPAPGVYGYENTAEGVIVMMTNAAAAALEHGDIVVIDAAASNVSNVETTTTVDDPLVFGVVQDPTNIGATASTSYSVGEAVPVLIDGVGRVNVGAGAPASGAIISTAATAGTGAASGTATFGEAIATVVNATKDANNCVVAVVHKF